MFSPTLKQVPFQLTARHAKQRLTLTIVFHPDLSRIGQQCQPETNSIEISRLFPLFGNGIDDPNPRPLSDPFLSRTPLRLIKKQKDWLWSSGQSPIQLSTTNNASVNELAMTAKDLQQGVTVILASRIVLLCHFTTHTNVEFEDNLGLIGVSDNLKRVRNLICKVSSLKTPVLIRGDSGTGKELIAQAIHNTGARKVGKLVSVNIAAVPKELVASELFGSVKGAFTGAMNRKGCFLEANDGSLFLDEIGEASSEVQVTLLRALETGVVQPVGSDQELELNTRIIAATDADLESLIGQESFKMPLLQRLSGLVIDVAPLNERKADIGCLLAHFLMDALVKTGQVEKIVSPEPQHFNFWAWFFAQCSNMPWPGNVRQLKNIATQLSVQLMSCNTLDAFDWLEFCADLHAQHALAMQSNSAKNLKSDGRVEKLPRRKPRDVSDEEILCALETHKWQIKLAASALNISRAALYQRIDSNPSIRRAGKISTDELQSSYLDCNGNVDKMVNKLHVSKQALKRRLVEIGLAG